MATVPAGTILTINKARWLDDAVNDLVTVTNVVSTTVNGYSRAWTVTLQSPFTSNYRNGFVLARQRTYASPYYAIIAVNSDKTVLTVVGDWTPTPPTNNFSINVYDAPIPGPATVTTINIQRRYQWYRDGVKIERNADTGVYTTQNADIGKTISFREIGAYWDDLTSKISEASSSNTVVVTGPATDTQLVYSENVVYRGSFAFVDQFSPDLQAVSTGSKGLSISSYNGQKTIYASNVRGGPIAEYVIPALKNMLADPNLSYGAALGTLNQAQFARTAAPQFVDPTEGNKFNYGCQGNAGVLDIWGTLPLSNNKLLLSGTNFYTYAQNTAMWTRPKDLTITGQVSKPFFIQDLTSTPRWVSAYNCDIPSYTVNGKNYQDLLGGNVISGAYALSVTGACAGPGATVWNTADIDPALARAITTSVSIVSQSGAAANEYYLGLPNVSVNPTNDILSIASGGGRLQTLFISAWNSSTKVATLKRADFNAGVFKSTNILDVIRENPVKIKLSGTVGSLYEGFVVTEGGGAAGITIKNIVGTTQLNNNSYYIKRVGRVNESGVDRDILALYSDIALTTPVNGTSYTAYVSGGTADTFPTSTSTAQIVPRINGKLLLGHTDMLEYWTSWKISSVFSNASGGMGHFIPTGTKSFVCVGTGSDGEWLYSAGAFGFVGSGPIVYDTGGGYAGPHCNPWKTRVWCYDLDTLVSVKDGTRQTGTFTATNPAGSPQIGETAQPWDGSWASSNQLKPYAVFGLNVPYEADNQFTVSSVCYDPSTRMMYLAAAAKDGGGPAYGRIAIHVYEITNAVAV